MAQKKTEALVYKMIEGSKYPVEDLNIERNWKFLTLYALRKYGSVKRASPHLGVTERTVHRFVERWNLDWKLPELEALEISDE